MIQRIGKREKAKFYSLKKGHNIFGKVNEYPTLPLSYLIVKHWQKDY